MRPLRLAIVTRRFWPLVGGTEKVLANLAVEFTRRGCVTTILTVRWQPQWPQEIHLRGVPVVRWSPPPIGSWKSFRSMRSLGRWLRSHREQFDLVYVATLREEAHAAIHALDGRVPVVLRPRQSGRWGDCLWQIEARGGRRIKDTCMNAAGFLASTPALKRELEAAGYPRPRIQYVADGVALPPARAAAARTAARGVLAEAYRTLELAPHAALVLCLGRVEEGRGLNLLLAAWLAVARRRPEARLWLVGETHGGATIQRRIDNQGLTNRVLLTGSFDEVEELLAAADLVVAPSPEGSPVAVLEAMAAGLPVATVDAPSQRHLITDGQEGFVVPGENAEALATALAGLLDDPQLAARLGEAGRARVAAEFSLARMVEDHLTWFERWSTP